MSIFDEVYSQTASFVPTEEWLESQGENWEELAKPIRTVGNMTMEIVVDYKGFDKKTLGLLFGIENYLDENGRHRVKDINDWETKAFDELKWGVPQFSRMFIFNTKPERIPLCPIGLGRA